MNYYDEIKNILVDNAIGRNVREYKSNQKDLESYYNVGKLLVEAQGGEERAKYGDGLIKEYSKRLTSELKKEYIRQIQTYMNYIDINLRKEFHNKTTGILLVRENNEWLIKYINNNDIVVRKLIVNEELILTSKMV